MAVQRQTAASRSARPLRRLQHGVFDGVPMTMERRSLSKLAHTPNLRVSFGQVALGGFEGVGGTLVGGGHGGGVLGFGGGGHDGGGLGFGGGGQPFGVLVEVTRVKKRRFKRRRRVVLVKALEAILSDLVSYKCGSLVCMKICKVLLVFIDGNC
ncbi:hypothetical protein L2E82_39082 [Cichorium intybus]|uniref:Uncharacterized protein n=1 Tax=Cichorium intybus TaxID=13427 RepID=A0ACB9AGN9_CICIN|nr:hypothetical protein L2E82_39082 [Cichorium intybus]